MNSKLSQLRKKSLQKQAVMGYEAMADNQQKMGMVIGQALTTAFAAKNATEQMGRYLKAAEWRFQALFGLLSSIPELQKHLTEERLSEMTTEIQIKDFNSQSAEDDQKRNLVNADDEEAKPDYFAIFSSKVFFEGQELKDQNHVRAKVQLGKSEMLPEIDIALLGMKVGDTKEVEISFQEKPHLVRVTLHGLRKTAPQETPKAESTQETVSSNSEQVS